MTPWCERVSNQGWWSRHTPHRRSAPDRDVVFESVARTHRARVEAQNATNGREGRVPTGGLRDFSRRACAGPVRRGGHDRRPRTRKVSALPEFRNCSPPCRSWASSPACRRSSLVRWRDRRTSSVGLAAMLAALSWSAADRAGNTDAPGAVRAAGMFAVTLTLPLVGWAVAATRQPRMSRQTRNVLVFCHHRTPQSGPGVADHMGPCPSIRAASRSATSIRSDSQPTFGWRERLRTRGRG